MKNVDGTADPRLEPFKEDNIKNVDGTADPRLENYDHEQPALHHYATIMLHATTTQTAMHQPCACTQATAKIMCSPTLLLFTCIASTQKKSYIDFHCPVVVSPPDINRKTM